MTGDAPSAPVLTMTLGPHPAPAKEPEARMRGPLMWCRFRHVHLVDHGAFLTLARGVLVKGDQVGRLARWYPAEWSGSGYRDVEVLQPMLEVLVQQCCEAAFGDREQDLVDGFAEDCLLDRIHRVVAH